MTPVHIRSSSTFCAASTARARGRDRTPAARAAPRLLRAERHQDRHRREEQQRRRQQRRQSGGEIIARSRCRARADRSGRCRGRCRRRARCSRGTGGSSRMPSTQTLIAVRCVGRTRFALARALGLQHRQHRRHHRQEAHAAQRHRERHFEQRRRAQRRDQDHLRRRRPDQQRCDSTIQAAPKPNSWASAPMPM